MKLSKELIDYIRTVVKVAKLVGIESVAIEKDLVRAMDENRTVVICHSDDVPDLPFDGIGIGRLDVFSSRFALIDGRDGFVTEAEISNKDKTDQVSQLTFKAKNIKVDYRCANSTTIKAPKVIKDPMKYEFALSSDAVDTLVKAQGAMGVEYITIISSADKGMCFELVDVNNDVFSHEFSDQAVSIDDRSDSEFVHRYPVKTLISLIKQDPTQRVQVSEKGILRVIVNSINVYVLPSI
jgi:hypothetical protein